MQIDDITYSTISGATITYSTISSDEAITNLSVAPNFTIEQFSMLLAIAGIALGLDKVETKQLAERAYSVCRGLSVEGKYEALITLAYEIKSKGA